MALPSARAWLRSGYIVSKTRANLDIIVIDLYIYTGTLTTDKPSSAQFRLQKTAFIDEAGTYTAFIDIAEYARDYVDVSYDFSSSDPSNAVWVEYDLYYADSGAIALTFDSTVQLTGLDGYGYFEDEENPSITDRVLMSNDYIVVPPTGSMTIPVLQDKVTQWELYGGNISPSGLLETVSAPATQEETANVVVYASTSTTAGFADFIRFSFSSGADQDITIKRAKCSEYDAIQCAFVNRFGAIQKVYFFGKSTRSMQTSETKFKRNIQDVDGTWDAKKHQTATLEKNGVTSVTLNTGWYPEGSNAIFRELFLSEKVWLSVSSQWLDFNAFQDLTVTAPVILKDQNITYKTSLNDKLINYTVNFQFASDRIASVR